VKSFVTNLDYRFHVGILQQGKTMAAFERPVEGKRGLGAGAFVRATDQIV
jgi:hypothetical protein